jgi:Uma2 family endonuclease
MAPAPPLMTVGEYFRTPETLAPSELAHGVLRVADAPTAIHQSAVAQLFMALHAHVAERRLGRVWLSPLDVVLDEANALIVQPDLMFISNAREWIVQERVRGAPDLVIEVLSPRPRVGRNEEHLLWFAKHGVRECWLVYQELRRVGVISFDGGRVGEPRVFGPQEKIKSSVLPEFSMSLREILDL